MMKIQVINSIILILKYQFFLKDISEFFKNVTILKFAEFNIGLKFIENMIISSRENIETTIKSCHLFVKEVELYENDHIKYLKMLYDGYSKNC